MRKRTSIGAAILLSVGGLAFAQQDIVGKWGGTFVAETSRRSVSIGVGLEIASAADGKVAGKFTQSGGACSGDYDIEGTYKDSALRVKIAAGSKQGCGGGSMQLALEGGKLVGKYGKNDLTLTK